jgi:hypothetical protein
MKYQITGTTDRKFIGHDFDDIDHPLEGEGVQFSTEKVEFLEDEMIRLSSSNYVIIAKIAKEI